jgi:8-oxo-dGTP pyrophosphatase MutT (NUDIX family)
VTGTQRHTEPLDVHLIAVREGAAGLEVLLSRRAGDVYAAGCWHLVSGHLDGPWEDMVAALVREAREEAGVVIDRADVRAAVTIGRSGYQKLRNDCRRESSAAYSAWFAPVCRDQRMAVPM